MKIKHNIVIYDDDLVFLEQLHEQVCNILSKHYYNCEISMFNNSNDFIKYCRKRKKKGISLPNFSQKSKISVECFMEK